MGTKQVPGQYDCHAKAEIDEPLFTLLARDPTAPDLIRIWANERELNCGAPEKIQEARDLADAMDEWRSSKLDKPARFIHSGLTVIPNAEINAVALGKMPDYESPLMEVHQQGAEFAVQLLAKHLGVTDYTADGGTDDYEGDLLVPIASILERAFTKHQARSIESTPEQDAEAERIIRGARPAKDPDLLTVVQSQRDQLFAVLLKLTGATGVDELSAMKDALKQFPNGDDDKGMAAEAIDVLIACSAKPIVSAG